MRLGDLVRVVPLDVDEEDDLLDTEDLDTVLSQGTGILAGSADSPMLVVEDSALLVRLASLPALAIGALGLPPFLLLGLSWLSPGGPG